jgi:hypothetical protein
LPLKRFLLSLAWSSLLRGVHVRGKAKPFQVEQPKRIPMLPLNMLNDTLSIWIFLPLVFLFMYCHVLYFSISRMWSLRLFFYRIQSHSSIVNGSTQRQASSIRRMWLAASPDLTCGGTDSDHILNPSKDSCAIDHTHFIGAGLRYHLYLLPEIVSLRLNDCRHCCFPACRKRVLAEYHRIVV